MQNSYLLLCIMFMSFTGIAQNQTYFGDQTVRKGRFYIYWGWNRSIYTDSNIKFTGKGYDFTLNDVVAKDRQSKFELKTYFSPTSITIPQYNFRIGYYLREHWTISLAMDHMKYVMMNDQAVTINGHIGKEFTPHEGDYANDSIRLVQSFLRFEHTDGLNYLNSELRRFDQILNLNQIRVSLTEGLGIGALIPRTNTTLLNMERYDEFHLAGFGVSGVAALRISFLDKFFIQTEAKGGYINMMDIRTTHSTTGRASQSFLFAQANILFGTTMRLQRKNY